MRNQPYYLRSSEEVLSSLSTSDAGLANEERVHRLELYGRNQLVNVNKKSQIAMFLSQFKDLMVILLLVSAVLAYFLDDTRTTIILLVIVGLNTFIGYFQEAKAEHELDALKKLIKAKAKIYVGGVLQEVESSSLVPGDIVFLEAGDAVPADLRIIEEQNLQTNDFSLTGESNPKKKHEHAIIQEVELGDRTNLLFMGTTVAIGSGKGVVIGTGMDTEFGKIAKMSTEAVDSLSPMQLEMKNLAKTLTVGTILLGSALFFVTLGLDFGVKEALLFALGIAASMVPQGLPSQVSVVLTSATFLLAKKNALVKKLSSVETLGAVQVICTDKTGTLTKNEMTVVECYTGGTTYQVIGTGYQPQGAIQEPSGKVLVPTDHTNLFFSVGLLASNARVHAPDADHPLWYVIGDPTEGALITLGGKAGLVGATLEDTYPLIKEYSFDSARKRMSCLRQLPDGRYRLFVKGALQSMLDTATTYADGTQCTTCTTTVQEQLHTISDERSTNAMRVLCYGYRDFTTFDPKRTYEEVEKDITILGLVAMIDPPRDEVMAAIEAAYTGHIKVFVITGDYALTAQAIAKRIGLDSHNKPLLVIQGTELRAMSDTHVMQKLSGDEALIFSRVSPEDKVRIVQLCKKVGLLVAVTGDGVNDAPALKNADIGVAMGRTGTDVAKEAAEIVLLDDSFATLVDAIQKGRVIYQNIKKIVLSCITTNLTELTVVLISLMLSGLYGWPLALITVQILAIDLVGEMFPLAALAWDPPLRDALAQPPRDTHQHIMHRRNILDLVCSGVVMGGIAYSMYVLYFVVHGQPLSTIVEDSLSNGSARSLVYMTIILSQYVNIMSRRSGTLPLFSPYFWSNKKLFGAFGIAFACILLFIYLPVANTYFGTGPLGMGEWGMALAGAMLYGIFRERWRKRWPTE